ncbi:hypothetical protein P175DRAFT_0554903 [Aspergillus ochraceoroseus IBT 24754]|uniref:Glycosyl transferase n=2 Tax=Aspergillus ochraceoroseus TaxID=138278 RepID=A0A2T5MAV7_9EURO|nr:uncharacterized protein P175DRAFT_0554903 [Aspergillus ochraceoroseus IBT 24754]KKK21996.1 hypothetical protein AOCH_007514 [Aspergillus ochraceoroseus]PTU25673.1 hypothetical protein P175DRAFT_0554903 [Aspergillus ochraceoroseus IBT 24754]
MARTRLRVLWVCFLVFLGLNLYSLPALRSLYYLLRLPFVWNESTAAAVISQQHDHFDLTFAAYDANYSTSDAGLRPLIPSKLHHIHLGSNPPPAKWLAARAECLKHHKSWETFLWNDENAAHFVQDQFPHLYDMWNTYPFMVQRVDALRYMVLEKHGGVILDFDLACKRSLEPLRQFDFVAPAAHPTGVSIGMLLASPNNSFVKALVNNLPAFNRRWLLLPYVTVMFSTGCHYASTIYTLQQNRTNLRILAGTPQLPNLHMLNGFVDTPLFRHFGSSSWHSKDARLIAFFKNMDQRILFAVLVFSLAASVSFLVVLCAGRQRQSSHQDVESHLSQSTTKFSSKHA